jgi:cytochrome c oxidase subunit I+III
VVASRFPLWSAGGVAGAVRGLADDRREVLVTSVLDAVPDHRAVMPSNRASGPSCRRVAVTMLFVGSIFTPWAVVWGAVLVRRIAADGPGSGRGAGPTRRKSSNAR